MMPTCCAVDSGPLCYVCGGAVSRGVPVREWMTDSYVDQTRVAVPLSQFVCESCVFVMSRISPVPGRPPGKCNGCDGTGKVTSVAKKGKTRTCQIGDPCPKCEGSGNAEFGGNFRNYTAMFDELGYVNASKGEKQLIRDFLSREHSSAWFCGVADSGQKHVLPYTPINPPGRAGNVLFDEALVCVPDDTSLIDTMCDLLTDGATKEELERGDYRPATWQRLGADRIRAFERERGRCRGNWFTLALWLAQRDESAVSDRLESEKQQAEEKKQRERKQATKPRAANGNRARRNNGDDPGRVHEVTQGASAAQLLDGAAPKQDAQRSTAKRDSGRMDHDGSAKAADGRTGQLGLFGDQ
mgnify:CR=1 FL=1